MSIESHSRRTPPKDDLSALVDECSQLASKFSEELKDLREEETPRRKSDSDANAETPLIHKVGYGIEATAARMGVKRDCGHMNEF